MTPKRRSHGSGSVYQRASDGRWVATIEAGWTKTGARRRITVTAKTKADVRAKVKLRERELGRNQADTDTSTRTTVKGWSGTWLDLTAKTTRPKTHTTDRGAVTAWIIPTVGHRRLDQLTPADVRSVATAITSAGLSTTTANRYQGVLIRMLKAATDEGHAVPARAMAVRPPAIAVHDRQAIPLDQALAMLEVGSTLPHGSRWAAALLQGMRQAECLGLTWDHVDDQVLTISWQLQALPYVDKRDRSRGFLVPDGYEARQLDRSLHLVRPKSRAGWRVIPLVPWMSNALTQWRAVAPASPHGLVWPALDGSPADARQDRTEWWAIQDTADVHHPSGRWYKGHEARHTTATLLMQLGVPASVITAIIGHSTILSTQAYLHADQTQTRAALEQMAERLQLG